VIRTSNCAETSASAGSHGKRGHSFANTTHPKSGGGARPLDSPRAVKAGAQMTQTPQHSEKEEEERANGSIAVKMLQVRSQLRIPRMLQSGSNMDSARRMGEG